MRVLVGSFDAVLHVADLQIERLSYLDFEPSAFYVNGVTHATLP